MSNCTPVSLHVLKCSCAHTLSCLIIYSSFAGTGHADIMCSVVSSNCWQSCGQLKARTRIISLFTGPKSGAHPFSYSMAVRGSCPRVQCGWIVQLSSHRHLFLTLRWRDVLPPILQMSTQRKLGRGYKSLTDDVTAQSYPDWWGSAVASRITSLFSAASGNRRGSCVSVSNR